MQKIILYSYVIFLGFTYFLNTTLAADTGNNVAGEVALTGGSTYTAPSNITALSLFEITMVGGGGGGGGINTASASGSGGGGGATCTVYTTGIVAGSGYSYTIGSGGATVAGTGAPSDGTDTTFINGAVTYTASHGAHGLTAISSLGGVGGACTNTNINTSGQQGGGSSAASTIIVAGNGGSSLFGIGGSNQGGGINTNGLSGTGYGAGGSAAHGLVGQGGTGSQGIIIIKWHN